MDSSARHDFRLFDSSNSACGVWQLLSSTAKPIVKNTHIFTLLFQIGNIDTINQMKIATN